MREPWAGPTGPVRRGPVGGWWLDGLLLGGFVLVTVALATGTRALDLDVAVADWADAHRPRVGYLIARGLNYAGQGGPLLTLTGLIAAWLAWRRRSWWPLLVPTLGVLLTYLAVGPVKLLTDRAAPSEPTLAHPELLFHDPGGMSYPSGHVVNALVWYTALLVLLGDAVPSRLAAGIQLGAPVLIVATTTYLGWHWISDGVAAVLLGLPLARLLRRVTDRWVPA